MINKLSSAAAMCVSLTTMLCVVGAVASGDKYVFMGKSDFDFWAILVLFGVQFVIFFFSLTLLIIPPPAYMRNNKR